MVIEWHYKNMVKSCVKKSKIVWRKNHPSTNIPSLSEKFGNNNLCRIHDPNLAVLGYEFTSEGKHSLRFQRKILIKFMHSKKKFRIL